MTLYNKLLVHLKKTFSWGKKQKSVAFMECRKQKKPVEVLGGDWDFAGVEQFRKKQKMIRNTWNIMKFSWSVSLQFKKNSFAAWPFFVTSLLDDQWPPEQVVAWITLMIRSSSSAACGGCRWASSNKLTSGSKHMVETWSAFWIFSWPWPEVIYLISISDMQYRMNIIASQCVISEDVYRWICDCCSTGSQAKFAQAKFRCLWLLWSHGLVACNSHINPRLSARNSRGWI